MPRRPGNDEVTEDKIPYIPPLEVNEKTPKGQVQFVKGWNRMRDWIIRHGGMEEK